MRKLRIAVLLALCLWLGAARAETTQAMRERASNLLTEVYGYTVAESQAFAVEGSEENGVTELRFYPADHPSWVYTAMYDENTNHETTTPFFPDALGRNGYPGEGTVREGVRRLRTEWLPHWNDESRAAMREWMKQWNVSPNAALLESLAMGKLSPGDTLHAFLVSCYDEPIFWPKALGEWERELLDELELSVTGRQTPVPGVARWQKHADTPGLVTRFVGETPPEFEALFATLEGWSPLCGAVQAIAIQTQEEERKITSQVGLVAFAQGERRLLVLMTADETGVWRMESLGEDALYSDRDFWIDAGAGDFRFEIVYPISDTESEWFTLGRYGDEAEGCHIEGYTRVDTATGEGISIRFDWSGYTVTASKGYGRQEQETITRLLLPRPQQTPLTTFPTTLEACREPVESPIPEGYGFTNGVHLRARTSSRSKDLGDYNAGALVKVLGREEGDPYDWYRVRVGSVEGYMSSIYVNYEGGEPTSAKRLEPLPVGEAKEDLRLKSRAGWFGGTVREVPAGTRMHIMAECGDWLHVMIPREEITWLMDVDGTDGYVKADEVELVSLTALP